MASLPTRTIIRVDNLHCQSCVSSIQDILASLESPSGALTELNVSIDDRLVAFTHPLSFDLRTLLKTLDASGFDVEVQSSATATSRPGSSRWGSYIRKMFRRGPSQMLQHAAKHKEVCAACREEKGGELVHSGAGTENVYQTSFMLEGITCRRAQISSTCIYLLTFY